MTLSSSSCVRWVRRLLAGALIGSIALSTVRPALAGPVAVQVNVAEDEAVVANPSDMMAQMLAAWQLQHVLLVARKMPYIQIDFPNDPTFTSTAQLSNFKITIGDGAAYSWDLSKIVSMSPGITATLVTPDTVQMGVRSDVIEYNFTGFTKGKYVRIQTDIDPDAGNNILFPDYRFVMFDMNGGNGPNDNSLITASFTDVAMPPVTVSEHLPDYVMLYPTNVGVSFLSAYSMDHVQPFGAYLTTVQPVPEPSSLALAGMGGLGALFYGLRRRRAKRSLEITN